MPTRVPGLTPQARKAIARAQHIVMQRGMRVAGGLAAFEGVDRALPPREGGDQIAKLHPVPSAIRRCCPGKLTAQHPHPGYGGKLL